jgi:hypothetical protein
MEKVFIKFWFILYANPGPCNAWFCLKCIHLSIQSQRYKQIIKLCQPLVNFCKVSGFLL